VVVGAASGARERQARAAELEEAVRELHTLLEAKQKTLAEETIATAGRRRGAPLVGVVVVLLSVGALVAAFVIVAAPPEAAPNCAPIAVASVTPRVDASSAEASTGVFEASLRGQLDAAPPDAGVTLGVPCTVRLTGRRRAERIEVEQISARCGDGSAFTPRDARVFQASVDVDPRAPARRLDAIDAQVSDDHRHPVVTLSGA
jgi:hypothetical protein